MKNLLSPTIALATLVACIAPSLSAQTYTIEDIGSLIAGGQSLNGGLNNLGQVTGTADAPNGMDQHAFFWHEGSITNILPLSSPNGGMCFGNAIDDNGVVYGYSFALVNGYSELHAFGWDGSTFDLHVGDRGFSRINAVNESGERCGIINVKVAGNWIDERHAYLESNGSVIDLGTFGGDESHANGINELGDVVGFARQASGKMSAFLYSGGVMLDIGHLGDIYAVAKEVNNSQVVVGLSRTTPTDTHAFMWDGQMHDLGTLGGNHSEARGINESGVIVGQSSDANGDSRAAIWTIPPVSSIVDLNTLIPPGTGWELTGAGDINELGQISGTGYLNGVKHAYLLTPVLQAPRLSTPVPGIAGRMNTLHVIGANPNSELLFVGSVQAGATSAAFCSGVTVDMANPMLLGRAMTDSAGRAALEAYASPLLAGRIVLLQAFDPNSCQVSDLVTYAFP